jgi:hypothetical protein
MIPMIYDDLISHFRTQVAAAEALGVFQSTVSDWKARGAIPPLRQLQVEALTAGKLKAGPECDRFRVPAATGA